MAASDTIEVPATFIPDDDTNVPKTFVPDSDDRSLLENEVRRLSLDPLGSSLIPSLLLPPEAPGSLENVLRKLPLGAGGDEALREARVKGISSAGRAIEEGVRSAGLPENLPLVPIAANPIAGRLMALYFGAGALGSGAGEASVGFERGEPETAGRGTGTALLGTGLLRQGLRRPAPIAPTPTVAKPPTVPVAPVVERAPIVSANLPAPETLVQEPSGLRVVPQEQPKPAPQGGIPANAEMLETLPKPTVEELAVNELTRSAEGEMARLVAEEGKAVERTGEALPKPAEQGEVPIGNLPAPETLPLQPSGLRMAVEDAVAEAKGGLATAEPTLDLLPAAKVEELAINELLRRGIERGAATQLVESLGDAIRRVKDYPRAAAEKIAQQIAEGVKAMVHPDKPLTANQVKITYDALTKAITENRLSEERPGIISGTGLEKWADATIKEGRGRLNVGLDPVQLAAYIVKGAALLERGITDIAKWTAAMIKEYGPQIRPYLKQIREHSEQTRAAIFRASQGAASPQSQPANVGGTPAVPTQPTGTRPTASQSRFRTAMSNLWEDIKATNQRRPVKRDMSQLADAMIDTIPANKGREAGQELRVLTQDKRSGKLVDNSLARKAAVFVIQAKGNRAKLDTDLVKVAGDADAEAAIRYAQDNWDDLQPLAQRTRLLLDEQMSYEGSNGIDVAYENHYVPQRHENILTDRGVLFGEVGGKPGSTGFKKAKVFPDYASAIEAGYKPKNLDIADLVEHRVRTGQRLVNRKLWAEGFKGIADPYSGDPIMTDMVSRRIPRPDGTVDTQFSAPQGYVPKEIIPGVRIAVRQGYSHLFNALTGTSQIRESAVGRAGMASAGWLKHRLLLLDSFHASRTMQTSLAARGSFSYDKGLSLLELSDRALTDAVDRNLITSEMASWVRTPQALEVNGKTVHMTPRELAQLGQRNGLNVGRFADALYTEAKGLLGTSRFTKWLFEKLTRGAMVETFLTEFERVAKSNPNLNETQVARQVARDINVLFGNLQRQSIIKNPAIRDLMQMAFLAPQWVESLARRELRAVGQTGKTVADVAAGKGLHVGTVAKTVGTGLAAYVALTQLLNYLSRGHSTLDNEEGNHKLDAFIPDLTGQSEGFWFSPLSVFGEITHNLIRYSHTEPTAGDIVSRIASNKLGPVGRALMILGSGEDAIGTKLPTTWDRAQEAGLQLVPAPIGVQPAARALGKELGVPGMREPRPGELVRQGAGSLGFKIEPYKTNEERVKRAREINTYIEYWIKRARQMPINDRRRYIETEMHRLKMSPAERNKTKREIGEAGVYKYK